MKKVNNILIALLVINIIILISFLLKKDKINQQINNLNTTVYIVDETEVK